MYELSGLGNVFQYGVGGIFDLDLGTDRARDIALPSLDRMIAVGREIYVLMGGGAVVRLTDSAAPEVLNGDFLGFDFARDLELVNDEGGRVILDGAGFLHILPEDLPESDFRYQGSPFFYEVVTSGGLPLVIPLDEAVDLEITADSQNYMILRRDGQVYLYGETFPFAVRGFPTLVGAEARDIEIVPGEQGYWILDSMGNIHRFEDTPTLPSLDPLPISDAVDFEFNRTGDGIYVMDAYGAVYPFGDNVVDLPDASGTEPIWKDLEGRRPLSEPAPEEKSIDSRLIRSYLPEEIQPEELDRIKVEKNR
jgi:hypothetical protein